MHIGTRETDLEIDECGTVEVVGVSSEISDGGAILAMEEWKIEKGV